MTERPPIHGVLAILQSGIQGAPIDERAYEETNTAVAQMQSRPGSSLRHLLVGPTPTREERRAFRYAVQNARDFVSLTQNADTITPDRQNAAVALLNILLTAGSQHHIYDTEASKLVSRANPQLFSRDPLGTAAVTLYTIATITQTRQRMMQVMSAGLIGLKREVKGLPAGTNAALQEINRLEGNIQGIHNEGGKGIAERFRAQYPHRKPQE